ncbi:MAG TPA: methyltransferase domain-containing protein [Candidatus Lokiarchaeia archaeon]|nr:methyltransferase domain-containing protein [Candidatus Lokiarchaeia archaeon]
MEWEAEKYEKNAQLQFKIGMHAIDLLNPQGSEKVLDIGCGTGVLSLQIAQKLDSGTIIGVDPDASMIAFAMQAIDRNNATNFSVIQASATELDFHEEFDAVFSNIVIHWVQNVQKLFQILHAALKPGGRLVIATIYNPGSSKDLDPRNTTIYKIESSIIGTFAAEGYFADIFPAAELQAHIAIGVKGFRYNAYRLKALQRMLEKAGFQDIQLNAQLLWHEFETLDAYMDFQEVSGASWLWFQALFPATNRDNARLRFRELIRVKWEEIPVEQRECPIRVKWPVVFIQAKKE